MKTDFQGMVTRWFSYLAEEFGFSQENTRYWSNELEILILHEREMPGNEILGIYFSRTDEPDSPRLPFDWLLYYLENKETEF